MVSSRPSGLRTLNERIVCALSSVGLSIRYWMFGAVNVQGSWVGNSWVAGRQPRPAGGSNVTRAARDSNPRAHINVAGMFMCAWVVSIPR